MPYEEYTVCTFRLSQAIETPILMTIARAFLYVALAAWTLAMFGLVHRLAAMATRAFAPPSRLPTR